MLDINTKKNVAILLTGKLIEKVLGFAAIIFYARVFSAAELALVPLVFLLGNLSLVVFGFGILPTIVMETPRLLKVSRSKALSLIRRVLLIGMIGAVLSGIFMLLFDDVINQWMPGLAGLPTMSYWITAAVVSQSLFILLSQILSGLTKFWQMSVASMVVSLGRVLFVLGLYKLLGPTGIVAGLTLATGLGCLLSVWAIRAELKENISESYPFLSIFKLSWPFYMESYVMYLRSQGDQLAVTTLLGAEALAFYYVARRLYDMLKVLSDSIDSALIPALSQFSLKNRKDFSVWWHDFFLNGLSLSVPVAFLTAACVPFYVALIGWEKYQDAIFPAVILCLAFIVDIIKGVVLNRTIFVLCPPVKRLKITSIETTVMLPMLIVGALTMGATGVALAYLVSGIIAGLFAYFILSKELDIQIKFPDWSSVFVPATLAIIGMLGIITATWSCCGKGTVWSTGLATLAGSTLFALLYINLAEEKNLMMVVGSTSESTKEAAIKRAILRLKFRSR